MTEVRPAVPSSDGDALAARVGATRWDLEVVDTFEVTPGMRRVRFTAPGLGAMAPEPGQDLMLAVPGQDGSPGRRRYTIRHFSADEATVDIDIVLHGHGPGARWAASVAPGSRLEGIGPRGKVTLVPGVDWHLFVGDESGIPAAFAMIEALPPGSAAVAVLEIAQADQEQPRPAPAGVAVELRWVHRGGTEAGRPDRLVEAVGAVPLPSGPGHAYLTGELSVVAAVGEALAGRGLAAEQLSPKAYWRRGVANAQHGEPPRL